MKKPGNQTKPEPSELTEEKSLWAVFRASRTIPAKAFVETLRLGGVCLLASYASFTGVLGAPTAGLVATGARDLAKDGLSFASQVIGFVLAGFTIFATMNARSFTHRMASVREPSSGHSYLKYVYLSFMRVFALYIGFIVMCLAVRLAGDARGFVSTLLSYLPPRAEELCRSVVARGALLVLAATFWLIVVELYSFTFNIYHTVMSGVRWELENDSERSVPPAEGSQPARTVSPVSEPIGSAPIAPGLGDPVSSVTKAKLND